MVITEYGNMFSLYIFGLLLLPAVVMGCLGKKYTIMEWSLAYLFCIC